MTRSDSFLQEKIDERKAQNSFRQLRLPQSTTVDFCSNDYLGIVKNNLLQTNETESAGATGSRLISGNNALVEKTETTIAAFHETEAALIFNSGYDANIGLLSAVPKRGDTILYDYLSHASIRDGIRLSFADAFSFAHNDLNDLEIKLKKARGNIFIVTESVFSMDGDICPLAELVCLSEKYSAQLIIDEAHATGVIGEKGEGLVQSLGLQKAVFARLHTFGKACGCHGATVVGSQILKEYLINFARSFIYSTALPPQAIAHIQKSYTVFPTMVEERRHLKKLISHLQSFQTDADLLKSETPVQALIIVGNEQVKTKANFLQANGLDVRPILYPTVPKGGERLRIVLHSFNTIGELDLLCNLLKKSS